MPFQSQACLHCVTQHTNSGSLHMFACSVGHTLIFFSYQRSQRAANGAKNITKVLWPFMEHSLSLSLIKTSIRSWCERTTTAQFSDETFNSNAVSGPLTWNVMSHSCVFPVRVNQHAHCETMMMWFKMTGEIFAPQIAAFGECSFIILLTFLFQRSLLPVVRDRMENNFLHLNPKGSGIMPSLHFLLWSWWEHFSHGNLEH